MNILSVSRLIWGQIPTSKLECNQAASASVFQPGKLISSLDQSWGVSQQAAWMSRDFGLLCELHP